MKYRILALGVVAVLAYSCATKSSMPSAAAETKATPAVLSPELAEGKSLFENSCARCHKLYDPKDFSAEQWKPIVLRMTPKARLNEEQGQKIYNYLTMK